MPSTERLRLFALPRSSWADYDTSSISAGGGVFARTEKSINVSPAMRKRLAIDAAEMTPNELISAHPARAGRSAVERWHRHVREGRRPRPMPMSATVPTTRVRVNGDELRCRIVGEGGNLGFTQRGRVEYALAGGLINTDAIDNSAGVDCSDHEVNIKIVLNGCVQRGELTVDERNDAARLDDRRGRRARARRQPRADARPRRSPASRRSR